MKITEQITWKGRNPPPRGAVSVSLLAVPFHECPIYSNIEQETL